MGPNSQVVRRPSSPIKTGNYSPINGPHSEEPFNSGSEITLGPSNPPQERGLLASNHRLISGISENEFSSSSSSCNIVERSVSICNHKSKHQQQQQLKNGHRKYNNNQEQRKHFKRIFKCNFCGYVTDRRNNLARHVSTMHDACKQLLECCGMRFESKATFRYHINECHREGYSCAICGHNFHRKALLKRHMSIHSGRKEFSCTKCNYGTSHKSNLERHKKVHSKEMPSNRKKESVEHGTKEDEEEEEKKSPPPPPLPSPTRLPYPKAATTVPTNHMTSPREGTSPSDLGLPLKKRLLRLGDNSEPVSMVENDKYVVRYDEWSDRNTAVEQTQPLDLHKEQHKHGSNTDLVHMHPLNGGIPWTLLTPAIYSYKTTVPQHVSYPNLYSVDPQYQYQHHHEGANSRMEHWNGEEHRIYTDNHHQQQQQQEEVERRSLGTGKKRIMATPYKCFECNCRLSSQFALAVHLQSYHPMADVVTLSIVTLLNNMNKVKNRSKVPSNEDPEDRCQYQKEELQEFLLAQL